MILRPIFAEKKKTAAPKEFGCLSCEVNAVIRPENPFAFPILAEKSFSISVKTFFFLKITCFWAKKPFEFPIWEEKFFPFFFFFEITCLWAEKPFKFSILDENSFSISVKTFLFIYLLFWG